MNYKATIEAMSSDGRGIARIEGKTHFIEGALLNETVTFQIKKQKSKYNEGVIEEVLQESPERAQPQCPHYGVCGGCSLQHLKHDVQIQQKQAVLKEQLTHFGQVEPQEWLPPMVGPEWGYRHKARLGVRYVTKKERVLVGFREKGGRYLADLTECHTLVPKVGYLLQPLSQLIQSLSVYKDIAQIEVACGDGRPALVYRNLSCLTEDDLNKLIEFSKEQEVETYLQPGNESTVYKVWPVSGPDRLTYTLPNFGLTMAFHPMDFVQINPEINQKMTTRAIELLKLESTDKVLDLFCGLGNFTLPLATRAANVIGVEGSKLMCERGAENAKANQLSNVDFYAADLSKDCLNESWATQDYDKVLLDPPRSGAQAILPVVGNSGASRIVYVSCNPATLARDAGELVHQYGYQLSSTGILDMFPQTKHVESIALFEK